MVAIPKNWKSKTVTIHDENWDDTETVTLKGYVGDIMRQKVLSASTEYHRESDGSMTIIATLDKLSALKRELSVTGWTLRDEDGDTLPFNADTLNNLPTEVTDFIDSEINKIWEKTGEPISVEEAEEAKNDL